VENIEGVMGFLGNWWFWWVLGLEMVMEGLMMILQEFGRRRW
jgi:hypothetical protein